MVTVNNSYEESSEEEIVDEVEEEHHVAPLKIQKSVEASNEYYENSSYQIPSDVGVTPHLAGFGKENNNNSNDSNKIKNNKKDENENEINFKSSEIQELIEILKLVELPKDYQGKFNQNITQSTGRKILSIMGYQSGQDLNLDKSGRVTTCIFNRSCMGVPDFYTKKDLGEITLKELDFPHKQEIHYISHFGTSPPSTPIVRENIQNNLKIGEKGQEPARCEFCSQELIDKLEKHKSALDDLDLNLLMQARRKSNPYETIRGSIFLTRAAIKMANLEAITHVLTPLIPVPGKSKDFIYFADVCAGPGGFTEYTYWNKTKGGKLVINEQKRLDDLVKGFGFTLKGDCDWNFSKFSRDITGYGGKPENFEEHYGVDGTGDILKSENIKDFSDIVSKGTNRVGLNFFMADGGVSTDGNQNKQEFLIQHLVLCQFLTMFETLGKGGNFICKIFDTFNSFTVGLLYFIYQHFGEFAIIKPYTSRPFNSERYVVAKNLLEYRPKNMIDYLYTINNTINSGESVIEIINKEDINNKFMDYMVKTSTEIYEKQLTAFKLFRKFIQRRDEPEPDYYVFRAKCLEEWGLPVDEVRKGFNNNRGRGSGRGGNNYYNNRGRGGRGGYYYNNNNGESPQNIRNQPYDPNHTYNFDGNQRKVPQNHNSQNISQHKPRYNNNQQQYSYNNNNNNNRPLYPYNNNNKQQHLYNNYNQQQDPNQFQYQYQQQNINEGETKKRPRSPSPSKPSPPPIDASKVNIQLAIAARKAPTKK